MLISVSAKVSKSLRGAKAYIAKSRIKVEDDEHESNIKKGEKFYLKKLGQKHYLLDVEQEKGKEVWYQFPISAKEYETFSKKHDSDVTTDNRNNADEVVRKAQRANAKSNKGSKVSSAPRMTKGAQRRLKSMKKARDAALKELESLGLKPKIGKPGASDVNGTVVLDFPIEISHTKSTPEDVGSTLKDVMSKHFKDPNSLSGLSYTRTSPRSKKSSISMQFDTGQVYTGPRSTQKEKKMVEYFSNYVETLN